MSVLSARLKRKKRPSAEVQMAPMIDMVFLLLVFFMCVSSISQANLSVEVDLPDSTSSETPEELSGRVAVSIQGDAVYVGSSRVEEAGLQAALEELLADDSGVKLLLRADRGTPFSEVKKVMKAAANVGISDFIYATHQL